MNRCQRIIQNTFNFIVKLHYKYLIVYEHIIVPIMMKHKFNIWTGFISVNIYEINLTGFSLEFDFFKS